MAGAGALDGPLVYFARPRSAEHIPGVGHGYRSMRYLLTKPDRITAVMASSDLIASGVLQATREAALSVPGDISVIGFDDTLSEYLSPKLTTVSLPAEKPGQVAAKLLIDDLEGNSPANSKHKFKTQRQNTKAKHKYMCLPVLGCILSMREAFLLQDARHVTAMLLLLPHRVGCVSKRAEVRTLVKKWRCA